MLKGSGGEVEGAELQPFLHLVSGLSWLRGMFKQACKNEPYIAIE